MLVVDDSFTVNPTAALISAFVIAEAIPDALNKSESSSGDTLSLILNDSFCVLACVPVLCFFFKIDIRRRLKEI